MLFVLGSFVTVFADDGGMDSVRSAVAGSKVVIGGDAYVEGYWLGNHEMTDTIDDDTRFWNQRVRLKIHAAIGGVEVRTRLTTDDQPWDGANNTNSDISVDYAYLHVPVEEIVTLDFGRQKSDWGNKLYEWNVNRDRAKVTVDAVDKVSFGVYADKIEETYNVTGDDNLADRDDYALFVIANLNTVEVGLLGVMHYDGREEAPQGVGDSGNVVSVFANAEFAGVNIGTELATKMGDVYAYTDPTGTEIDDMQLGFFVTGGYAFGPVAVDALVGLTMDGYRADSHFTPTLMIGTDQTTAIMDFGGGADPATGDEMTTDTILVAGTASFQAIPDRLSIYGRAAFAMSENVIWKRDAVFATTGTLKEGMLDDTYEATAIELDAGLEFQIADNTTLLFDFGYLMLDEEDSTGTYDDDAFSVGQSINIVF
jgi:hypothetical protein